MVYGAGLGIAVLSKTGNGFFIIYLKENKVK
jgi:hypothetical protein